MQMSTEMFRVLAELGGTVTVVVLAFWVWNKMSEKKDRLIHQLLEDAKGDRELNRVVNIRNAEKLSKAHEEGMSIVAGAITDLRVTHELQRVESQNICKADAVSGKRD